MTTSRRSSLRFRTSDIEADRVFGDGEQVFVKWTITGTFTGEPWEGIAATGSSIELEGMDCFTVRDGLIRPQLHPLRRR